VIHDNCTIEDSLICDGVVVNKNCVIEAGSRLDKNVEVKEGVILAKKTLASCRKIVTTPGSSHVEFQLVTEGEVDKTCFVNAAIIDEVPEEMTLQAH
jgi:ADP-glucose pyrophosphorylase